MFLLPARTKKIQSKMKELDWPQAICRFFRFSRADNSIVSGRIWAKFHLIQAFKHALARMTKIQTKMKSLLSLHHPWKPPFCKLQCSQTPTYKSDLARRYSSVGSVSLGNQEAPRSILASGTSFREDLVMKLFLRPFLLFC